MSSGQDQLFLTGQTVYDFFFTFTSDADSESLHISHKLHAMENIRLNIYIYKGKGKVIPVQAVEVLRVSGG
jgi:hypothetical protein